MSGADLLPGPAPRPPDRVDRALLPEAVEQPAPAGFLGEAQTRCAVVVRGAAGHEPGTVLPDLRELREESVAANHLRHRAPVWPVSVETRLCTRISSRER